MIFTRWCCWKCRGGRTTHKLHTLRCTHEIEYFAIGFCDYTRSKREEIFLFRSTFQPIESHLLLTHTDIAIRLITFPPGVCLGLFICVDTTWKCSFNGFSVNNRKGWRQMRFRGKISMVIEKFKGILCENNVWKGLQLMILLDYFINLEDEIFFIAKKREFLLLFHFQSCSKATKLF